MFLIFDDRIVSIKTNSQPLAGKAIFDFLNFVFLLTRGIICASVVRSALVGLSMLVKRFAS